MTSDENARTEQAVGLDKAAELLDVGPDQVRAMIDEGLLTPLSGYDEPTFDHAEVVAARNLGG